MHKVINRLVIVAVLLLFLAVAVYAINTEQQNKIKVTNIKINNIESLYIDTDITMTNEGPDFNGELMVHIYNKTIDVYLPFKTKVKAGATTTYHMGKSIDVWLPPGDYQVRVDPTSSSVSVKVTAAK